MRHTRTDLYGLKSLCSAPMAFPGMLDGDDCIKDHPVQRPLARLWVMLSHWVIAYYGLIRDSQSSRCLIFFVQRVFALWPHIGWHRELPQFTPHIFSTVPSPVPRRFGRLPATVPTPSALAFAFSAEAQLALPMPAGSRHECVTRLQSSLYATARWFACPSPARAFTFKLAPPESPQ